MMLLYHKIPMTPQTPHIPNHLVIQTSYTPQTTETPQRCVVMVVVGKYTGLFIMCL